MKRNFYFPPKCKPFLSQAQLFFCCLLCSFLSITTAYAQLSGTYTIGGADGAYTSFQEAVSALETEGISGAVTFKVRAGTYEEQVVINNIPGNSCSTPIVFMGEALSPSQVILKAPEGSSFSLQVNGADGIEFRNLSLVGGVEAAPGTDCFQLQDNILHGSVVARSSAGARSNQHLYKNNVFQEGGIIKENEAPWNPTAPVFDDGLVIEGNEFPAQGTIFIKGQQGFEITKNEFPRLSGGDGISVINSWYGKEISENKVSINSDNFSGTAIALNSSAAAKITGNLISSVGGGGIGLEVSTGKSVGNEMLIANNLIYIDGYDARGHNYFPISNLVGMDITNNHQNKIKVFHNTIRVVGYSDYVPNYALSVAGEPNSFYILNNVISNVASGKGIVVKNPAVVAAMDYNNLYGSNLAVWGSQEINSLAEWQTTTGFDEHSIQVNPMGPKNPADALVGAGTYLEEVPVDYYGQNRNNPPTIGAIESEVTLTPLSGTYTIGGENPDFASFTEAVAALNNLGVQDSVLFKVRPGEYHEQLDLGLYGRNSKVTFEGESGDSTDVVLQYPFNYAITLQGSRNFTFRYMTIASGIGIGSSSNLLFENNIIRGGVDAYSVSEDTYRNNLFLEKGIEKRGEGYEQQAGTLLFFTDNGLVIQGNTFNVHGSAISLLYQENFIINDNTITLAKQEEADGVTAIRIDGSLDIKEVKNNSIISNIPNTIGIRFGSSNFDGDLPQELTHNKIVLLNGGTGIAFSYSVETRSPLSLVANNMISINGDNSSSGIKIYSTISAINFFYNSVYLYGNASNSKAVFIDTNTDFPPSVQFKNNILANTAGGYVMYGLFNYGTEIVSSSDFNNLYTSGDTLAIWKESAAADLKEWQAITGFDVHSLSVDPQFESPEELVPTNFKLSNAGTVIPEVEKDFFNRLREVPPTIGAVELLEEEENLPPVVNAGGDKTVTLPLESFYLRGMGRDPDGRFTAFLWEKVSGPSVTMIKANTANVLLKDLKPGEYIFRFSATDNDGATASDEMKLTVISSNQPPVISVGPDKTVYLPLDQLLLSAIGYDPDGVFRAFRWEKISGPSVSMSQERTANLILTDLEKGTYVFRFTATDNEGASASDEIMLTVLRRNQPPVVSAGADRTIDVSYPQYQISGIGYDPDGVFRAFRWEKISGPSVAMQQQNTANLILSDFEVGVYTFRFTATDNEGATASDEMTLTVNGANPIAGLENSTRITAYPNTFQHHINIAVEAVQQGEYSVEVYDMLGKIYYRNNFTADPLFEHVHRIDLSQADMKEGMYLIRVENRSRSFQKVVKVFKGY